VSRLLRLLLASFILVALATAGTVGTAHAQDLDPDWDPNKKEDKKDKDDDKDDDKKADGSSTDGDGDSDDGGSTTVGSLADYPAKRIDRPRVLPHMTLQAHGELRFTRVDLGGSSTSFTVLDFGGALGFMQGKAEAGIKTGLVLDPDTDLSKVLELHGAYSFVEKKQWAVAGELKTSFDLNDGADFLDGFSLGARGIYRLNDKMALLGGSNALEYSTGSENLDLNLQIGFLYQFTAEISGEAHTEIASLGLAGDTNDTTVILADTTPLVLTGYWTQGNKLDAWMSFGFDVNRIGDAQTITVGIAYRFGL